MMADVAAQAPVPDGGGLKRKLIRGGILFGVLVAVLMGLIAAVPGLAGVRSAIANASWGWVLAAFAIQLVAVLSAAVFVQAVFEELPRRLSWWQGCGMQGANALLPTAGSTGVSYWSVNSLGWETYRFVERTAVMIIAPVAPNLLLLILVGAGMGLGLFPGPGEWWLTWLPAAVALAVVGAAIAAAVWAERIAKRVRSRRLGQALSVVATGVTGTVAILRRRSWRVLGTWVDLLCAVGALWACLIAVGDRLPFAVVGMGYVVGQLAQVIPIPGGLGTIDAGVTGALLIYGAPTVITSAGELISHALALVISFVLGALAVPFLRREIVKARARRSPTFASDHLRRP